MSIRFFIRDYHLGFYVTACGLRFDKTARIQNLDAASRCFYHHGTFRTINTDASAGCLRLYFTACIANVDTSSGGFRIDITICIADRYTSARCRYPYRSFGLVHGDAASRSGDVQILTAFFHLDASARRSPIGFSCDLTEPDASAGRFYAQIPAHVTDLNASTRSLSIAVPVFDSVNLDASTRCAYVYVAVFNLTDLNASPFSIRLDVAFKICNSDASPICFEIYVVSKWNGHFKRKR